jgi:hypothetical protein
MDIGPGPHGPTRFLTFPTIKTNGVSPTLRNGFSTPTVLVNEEIAPKISVLDDMKALNTTTIVGGEAVTGGYGLEIKICRVSIQLFRPVRRTVSGQDMATNVLRNEIIILIGVQALGVILQFLLIPQGVVTLTRPRVSTMLKRLAGFAL